MNKSVSLYVKEGQNNLTTLQTYLRNSSNKGYFYLLKDFKGRIKS